jgi:hypothetical protein
MLKILSKTKGKKLIPSNKIIFPDCQVYNITLKEYKGQKSTENYLTMNTCSLTHPNILLNKAENKIVYYYPEYFKITSGLQKYDFERIDKLREKFNTNNLVILGYFQKHEVEKYFQNLNKYNLEMTIADIYRSSPLYIELGDDKIMLVLDKDNRIIYSDRLYFLDTIVRYSFWVGLILFNGFYIPYVNYLIN